MAGEIEDQNIIQKNPSLDRLRTLVRQYVDKHQYESALFWADKVVSLSGGEVQDIFWYAQTLYLTSQYHRAAHLLSSHQLHKKYAACRFLVAKCHYECGEHQETLTVLDEKIDSNGFSFTSSMNTTSMSTLNLDMSSVLPMPSEKVESVINLLRGRVHEAMDNRGFAAECFREALRGDVYCFEAFDNLVAHHMLTAQEERELLDSLPFTKQCPNDDEVTLLKYLYENKLKKYDKPCDFSIPPQLEKLKENLDITVSQAERLYYNCHFRECYKITTTVLNKDPYNSQCLPLHIAVLVELRKSNSLFYLAHKLVDLYPNKAVAWFAVGCYYLLIGKNDPARRYLSKATVLDRVFGPAWLAFGHSFAVENEHDQAMAAYFTAAQLMTGCHLPVLYIGLEYGLTNNTKLAERFFTQALNIAPDDPFVLHEMGVISFQNTEYDQSEKYLKSALEKIRDVSHEVVAEKWEPLLNNLGHTCRKLRKYSDALEYHRQALILCPQNPSTLSSIGYIHSLLGNNAQAVDYFHKALGLRRDDTFSTTMLGNVIEQLMSEMSPCEGLPDEIPIFQYDGKLDLSVSPKKSEDGTEKPEDDVADSSGEISMADASDMVYTPGSVSMGDASNLATDDANTPGVSATGRVALSNTETPEGSGGGNLETVATPAGNNESNISAVADSSVAETSSMVIDTDTDENSFTL